ncbi:MAG: GNAT family N-acetyltransferase [Pseudohongiella sp.]|uniref:GNAT family N-acetyltransferase n=1 Tax=Pseudohongiella sp. TaxID=1979412 RepID=UPI0034A03165
MKFIELTFESEAYERAWQLRQTVLREPLGLTLEPGERASEAEQRHFGLFTDDLELAGCISVVPMPDGTAKLRQMSVNPRMQGIGLGRTLLANVEILLAAQGFHRLYMHARNSAIGFYQKLGYQTEGDPFVEVTIPHIRMSKSLVTRQQSSA